MENLPNTPAKNQSELPTPPKTRSTSKKTVTLPAGDACPQPRSTSPSTRRHRPVRESKRRCVTAPLPSLVSSEESRIADSITVEPAAEQDSPSPSPSLRPALKTVSVSAPELAPADPAVKGPGRRKPARLSLSSRASSERTIQFSDSPTSLDDHIKGALRKPLTKKQRRQQDHGNNYLFEVKPSQSPEKTIWKIGFTAGPTYKRQKNIFNDCQHHSIRGQYDPGHVAIRLCRRAESLIHAELAQHRYYFDCVCRVHDHREYFDVDPQLALESIRRWRTFCLREPYDAKGRLQPFWEDRLRDMDRRQKLRADLTLAERRRQWDRFVDATLLEAVWYDVAASVRKLQDRGIWRTTAVVEFLVLAFMVLPLPGVLTLPYYAMAVWVIAVINEIKLSATLCALSWPPMDGPKKSALSRPATIEDATNTENELRGTSRVEDEVLPNDLGYVFGLPLDDDVFGCK
ncbi:hypothetical protein PG985_000233 [Apiospora marii]|uniref:uncharacterized protein n=1 Tax=Apiospora marii TaxID=335849 RepID=UPI0031305A62